MKAAINSSVRMFVFVADCDDYITGLPNEQEDIMLLIYGPIVWDDGTVRETEPVWQDGGMLHCG